MDRMKNMDTPWMAARWQLALVIVGVLRPTLQG
jgi:hypothetical protein